MTTNQQPFITDYAQCDDPVNIFTVSISPIIYWTFLLYSWLCYLNIKHVLTMKTITFSISHVYKYN